MDSRRLGGEFCAERRRSFRAVAVQIARDCYRRKRRDKYQCGRVIGWQSNHKLRYDERVGAMNKTCAGA